MPKATRAHPDAARFGAIITRLRTERGWTLGELAQRSRMNRVYLGVLEKGGNLPSLATLFEFAQVFGISAAEIVREVEEARTAARIKRLAPKPPAE